MSTSSLTASLASSPSALSTLAFRQEAGPRKAADQAGAPQSPSRDTDSVELSSQAQRLSQAATDATSDAPVRLDLVTRIRAQIAAGTYETPAKTEIAALKLRRELINLRA